MFDVFSFGWAGDVPGISEVFEGERERHAHAEHGQRFVWISFDLQRPVYPVIGFTW